MPVHVKLDVRGWDSNDAGVVTDAYSLVRASHRYCRQRQCCRHSEGSHRSRIVRDGLMRLLHDANPNVPPYFTIVKLSELGFDRWPAALVAVAVTV